MDDKKITDTDQQTRISAQLQTTSHYYQQTKLFFISNSFAVGCAKRLSSVRELGGAVITIK